MFNIVGTVTPSKSRRIYTESPIMENGAVSEFLSSDIKTQIKGRNYSLIAEADYEKSWKNSRFTGGVRYTGNWSHSEYLEQQEKSHTRWNNIYAFGEYWRRLGDKVDLTLGLGATQYYNYTGNVTNSAFFVRPKVNLRYRPSNSSTFKLNISAYGNTPSISQLTSVRQQIDNAQVSEGNNNLKNYTTYRSQLQYELTKGPVYAYLRGTYRYHHNPIMEYKYWEGEQIISSFANHRNAHVFNYESHIALNNWKNWISVSAHFGVNRYIMHGNNYTHTNNNTYWDFYTEISHWNWSIGAQINTNYNTLWGESKNGGGSAYVLALMYQHKNAHFMFACMNPFSGDYKVDSENRNRYAGYKRTQHLQATQRLCVLGIRWNIQWGRKHQSGSKRLNNSGGSESVKAAGKG